MFYWNLLLLGALVLVFSAVAGRVERSWLSGPILFTAFGLLFGPLGLGLLDLHTDTETLRILAELTLAVVLFSDAASANLGVLRKTSRLPLRLLLFGLPLTIALGAAIGWWLFPGLTGLEIALLATLLAPTDAALGQAVVSDPQVPARLREGLNVESGLNDGICVPILLLLLALASGDDGSQQPWQLGAMLLGREIGVGVLVGLGWSAFGIWLLGLAARRQWLTDRWSQLPVVALALLCFSTAQLLGGSGFIAAFCGGLLFGALQKPHRESLLQAAEGIGDTLSLITWVSFGAVILLYAPDHLDMEVLLYAVLSLSLIRMLPVLLVLHGTSLSLEQKLFVGWFGPRGLASIVFVVMVLEKQLPGGRLLATIAGCTVILSIIAHGISARPWVVRMGRTDGQGVGRADREP